MNICLKFGDTNYIGLVNAHKYNSFVNEEWELEELMRHFGSEMVNGHILVYQMTNNGIAHSWNIDVVTGPVIKEDKYFRMSEGYLKVTNNKLFVVDYDCLTMSAQFEDNKVPDQNCEKNEIQLENGIYKVTFYQYYDVDENQYFGTRDIDIKIILTKVPEMKEQAARVYWATYY